MANAYLNIYNNNPTAGNTDGTAVSTDGDYSNPISFDLDASVSETKIQTLAIRTETGYYAESGTTIADSGDTNDFWKLSLDNATWSDSIVFSDTITATNTLFFIKATSATTENPTTDRSVSFNVTAIIKAAV